jgi:hypothetical protein
VEKGIAGECTLIRTYFWCEMSKVDDSIDEALTTERRTPHIRMRENENMGHTSSGNAFLLPVCYEKVSS